MRLIMMPVIMYGTDITFLFTPLGWDASSANNPALETGRSDCYLLLLSLLINTYSWKHVGLEFHNFWNTLAARFLYFYIFHSNGSEVVEPPLWENLKTVILVIVLILPDVHNDSLIRHGQVPLAKSEIVWIWLATDSKSAYIDTVQSVLEDASWKVLQWTQFDSFSDWGCGEMGIGYVEFLWWVSLCCEWLNIVSFTHIDVG